MSIITINNQKAYEVYMKVTLYMHYKTIIIYRHKNNIIINILNYAYDRINGIEGYSVSARALAIFSGLGFKDDRLEHH
jgi:hypothetical protein